MTSPSERPSERPRPHGGKGPTATYGRSGHWFGLLSCLDITGLTLLAASRQVPRERRAQWLRQVTYAQYAVVAWVVVWAAVVAVALTAGVTGLGLYAPVGLLLAPTVLAIVGVWTPIVSAAVTRRRTQRGRPA